MNGVIGAPTKAPEPTGKSQTADPTDARPDRRPA